MNNSDNKFPFSMNMDGKFIFSRVFPQGVRTEALSQFGWIFHEFKNRTSPPHISIKSNNFNDMFITLKVLNQIPPALQDVRWFRGTFSQKKIPLCVPLPPLPPPPLDSVGFPSKSYARRLAAQSAWRACETFIFMKNQRLAYAPLHKRVSTCVR